MPIRLIIDRARRIVISCGSGIVTDEDLVAGRRDLQNEPDFDPTFSRIWDLTEATELAVSDEVLRGFAAHSLSDPTVRRAIACLAPSIVQRVLSFASLSRSFNQDLALFPSRREAEEWIAATPSE